MSVTPATYHYASGKINYIREFAGIRLAFVTLWPDSTEQAWLEKQPAGGPLLIFAHSQRVAGARQEYLPSLFSGRFADEGQLFRQR
jgi:hypothetical protein